MGYVYESAVYKLVFEGRFAGLEVYAQELSLQELLDFSALMWIDMTMATAEERVRARTQFMLDHIDRWNLEDSFQGDTKRTPVPLTVDALLAKGQSLHTEIMAAWLKEIVGLNPGPLVQRNESLTDGLTSSDVQTLSMIPMSQLGEETALS